MKFKMAIFQIIKRYWKRNTSKFTIYLEYNTKTFMVANCLSFLATLFLPLIAIDKVAKVVVRIEKRLKAAWGFVFQKFAWLFH